MKIKFDTGEITQDEAKGLIALLGQLAGIGDMSPTVRVGVQLERKITKAAELAMGYGEGQPAPDGYPVEAEQPADAVANASNLADFSLHRDVAGIPWDERIHASTKTTNKDGTWTRRRNTPDEVFDKVMAELKAANTAMTLEAAAGLTAPTPEPPQPSAAEAFTPPPSVVIPAHVPAPPAPPVPVPPVSTVPTPPAAASDTAAEPVEIMKAVNAKRVPADKLQEIMGKAGLDGLAKVFTAPIEARRIIAAELAAL